MQEHGYVIRPSRVRLAALAIAGALIAPVVGPASSALADEKGDPILRKVDREMTKAEDQFFEYLVVDKRPDKDERTMRMQVWIKGDKRLTEFLEPGDLKGTRALVAARDQLYVYMPAYRKVRRVASHATDQGFMGTAISNNELAMVTYAPEYTATVVAEDDATWTLALERKPGIDVNYPRIEMVVRKDINLPTEIRYINEQDAKAKTETRTGYECKDEICVPKVMKMTDHRAGGHWTKLVREKWERNQGLKDSFFAKRRLSRAR